MISNAQDGAARTAANQSCRSYGCPLVSYRLTRNCVKRTLTVPVIEIARWEIGGCIVEATCQKKTEQHRDNVTNPSTGTVVDMSIARNYCENGGGVWLNTPAPGRCNYK